MSRPAESLWSDPRQARIAGWLLVGLLTLLCGLLQSALSVTGVLDIDVINFGLAASDFDLLSHRPHPPGYPGYVLYLKLVGLVLPWLGPIEVATWASRLCGLALVPVIYLVAQRALGREAVGRPLACAALAVTNPILWYYGGDGQSHGADAIVALLLAGGAVAVKKHTSTRRLVIFAVALGFAGALRPTTIAVFGPIGIWLLWGRPARDWLLTAAAGGAAVLAWFIPLVVAAGGYQTYSRATAALVGELFIAHFSVFGERASASTVTTNAVAALASAAVATVPILAARPGERGPWTRLFGLLAAAFGLFYLLMFTAEMGYFSGLAAVACLAPITWSEKPGRWQIGRAAAVVAASLGFIAAGPATVPVAGTVMPAPTLARVASTDQVFEHHARLCELSAGLPTLLLTDNPILAHNRWLPLRCPDLRVAVHLHDLPYHRSLDVALIFEGESMRSLPGPIPLEAGGPGTAEVAGVAAVVVAPDASGPWRDQVAAQASCEPHAKPMGRGAPPALLWPAACLPSVALGQHRLQVRGPAASPR